MTDQPTKIHVDTLVGVLDCWRSELQGYKSWCVSDERVHGAIKSLISASPEAGERGEGKGIFTLADIEHLINGIRNKGDNPTWDGGWEAGVDAVLRPLGIRIWDNFRRIDEGEIEKLKTLAVPRPAPSPAPPLPRSVIDAQKELTLKEDMRIDRLAPQAPYPAEVEAAMERLGRCIGAAFSRRADLLFMARPGADHERGKDNAALATIRAALTEARQPKVVSREWFNDLTIAIMYHHGTNEAEGIIQPVAKAMLREKGIEVEEAKP